MGQRQLNESLACEWPLSAKSGQSEQFGAVGRWLDSRGTATPHKPSQPDQAIAKLGGRTFPPGTHHDHTQVHPLAHVKLGRLLNHGLATIRRAFGVATFRTLAKSAIDSSSDQS